MIMIRILILFICLSLSQTVPVIISTSFQKERQALDKECPNSCSGYGKCQNGKCICDKGRMGDFCQLSECLRNCGNRGKCDEGQCVCNDGWSGFDCLIKVINVNNNINNESNKINNTNINNNTIVAGNVGLKEKEDQLQKEEEKFLQPEYEGDDPLLLI
eukprot:c21328_g3_i2.p1 GENE.c21328_g3_i2~~c21328_g3_i2.p1  ORF type:complete len:159 (+),score=58.88 c21328_g3_i2:57-533(+)